MPAPTDLLFYAFATLTLVCGLLCVANPFNRNPVTSAMFLALSIVSLSGLFLLLHAFFLAAIQVLVYAGAIMVLFLFVIMLLDLKEEERRKIRTATLGVGSLAVAVIASVLLWAVWSSPSPDAAPLTQGGTHQLGRILFSRYALPFEAVSLLLLVAMIGVILLSKRQTK